MLPQTTRDLQFENPTASHLFGKREHYSADLGPNSTVKVKHVKDRTVRDLSIRKNNLEILPEEDIMMGGPISSTTTSSATLNT